MIGRLRSHLNCSPNAVANPGSLDARIRLRWLRFFPPDEAENGRLRSPPGCKLAHVPADPALPEATIVRQDGLFRSNRDRLPTIDIDPMSRVD